MRIPDTWFRRRRTALAVYWLAQVVVAYMISIALVVIFMVDEMDTTGGWLAPLGFTAVILGLQAVLLLPMRRPTLRNRGVSLFASLLVGGLLAALLGGALMVAVLHVVHEYTPASLDGETIAYRVAASVAAAWGVSTVLLLRFMRGARSEDVVRRVASGLFLGTVIEAVAVIPLDILIRRRTDCYCQTGPFFALVVCLGVGSIVFGPAVIIPLTAPHRKRWWGRRCEVCGYDLHGLRGIEECPECGSGWRPRKRSAGEDADRDVQ